MGKHGACAELRPLLAVGTQTSGRRGKCVLPSNTVPLMVGETEARRVRKSLVIRLGFGPQHHRAPPCRGFAVLRQGPVGTRWV